MGKYLSLIQEPKAKPYCDISDISDQRGAIVDHAGQQFCYQCGRLLPLPWYRAVGLCLSCGIDDGTYQFRRCQSCEQPYQVERQDRTVSLSIRVQCRGSQCSLDPVSGQESQCTENLRLDT
jgi:hypothetical protein